jgi:hypothetical protein
MITTHLTTKGHRRFFAETNSVDHTAEAIKTLVTKALNELRDRDEVLVHGNIVFTSGRFYLETYSEDA